MCVTRGLNQRYAQGIKQRPREELTRVQGQNQQQGLQSSADTSFKDKFLFKGLFQFQEAGMRCVHLPGQTLFLD